MLKACTIVSLLVLTWSKTTTQNACKKFEFQCGNGKCINLDRFCNGIPECNDQTDEFTGCTRKFCFIELFKHFGLEIELKKKLIVKTNNVNKFEKISRSLFFNI